MATQIIIDQVGAPYDGAYDLDLGAEPLDTFEWGWIKKHAGYLPTDDLNFGDPEFIVTIAAISLLRADKFERREFREVWDTLANAPFGQTIRLRAIADESEEQEAGDEPSPPQPSSSSRPDTSGADSSSSSETSDETPDTSGTPGSDGPESDRLRSVS